MRLFTGLDTSCYTTSFAVADENEHISADIREQLYVPEGGKGLRQSDGVFQHVKNMPDVFFRAGTDLKSVACVAASVTPRPAEGSYMPVFAVSGSYGRVLAQALRARFVPATHQHAHLYAALIGNARVEGDCLAVHVSGGTTEILRTRLQNGVAGEIVRVGGTGDIAAGQLIDRTGVRMGLPFPCGKAMEQMAAPASLRLPVSVTGVEAHFSGAETRAYGAAESGVPAPELFGAVFACVADTIARLVINACSREKIKNVLCMGGVIANRTIRSRLARALAEQGATPVFADARYAGDNAAGLAVMAKRYYFAEE